MELIMAALARALVEMAARPYEEGATRADGIEAFWQRYLARRGVTPLSIRGHYN